MNNKLAAVLSGSAALVLALTGCGGDDSDNKADEWAKKICDQVQPQVKRIQDANASISDATQGEKSSEEVKKTDAQAFQDIAAAYKALSGAVDNAGAPPVENGDKLRKDAVGKLNDLSKSYLGLKKQADELKTKDQAEFADGLKAIAEELGNLGKSGDAALSNLQSGELGQAMAEQDGCKKPSGVKPSDSAA